MEYPFKDESPERLYDQPDAIKRLEAFVGVCIECHVHEESFHLFLQQGQYEIVAESVKELYGIGKHIKEVKV